MPSCVVKSCRNHSAAEKKSQGVTFHRFPAANDIWKNDWIKIIRHCRNESSWNPTKSSVVCSAHFDPDDLYTTKGGLIRVANFAVPKKFLFEKTSVIYVYDPHTERNNSNGSEGNSLEIKTELSESEHEIPIEENSSGIKTEVSSESEQEIKIEENTIKENPLHIEHPTSVNFSYDNYTLKAQLLKMHDLNKTQLKKIKVLNQKVRRLQDKNNYLKCMLSTYKQGRNKSRTVS